jgi:hypothetical protein
VWFWDVSFGLILLLKLVLRTLDVGNLSTNRLYLRKRRYGGGETSGSARVHVALGLDVESEILVDSVA